MFLVLFSSTTAARTLANLEEISVEHLGADEIARCKHIRLDCLADAPYAFGSTFEAESIQPDDWWRQRLTDGHWVVAHAGGEDLAVAMLMYQRLPETFEALPDVPALDAAAELPWVRAVWTRPEHRGRGLVDVLLNHLGNVAAKAGAESIILGVRAGNERAINAYLRLGYQHVGMFWPSSASVPEPNYLMAKSLL